MNIQSLYSNCWNFYIRYIDFREAFDSIWKGMWRVLRSIRYVEKIVRLLENMYRGTFGAARTGGRAI